MEWFERWFGDEYLIVYEHRNTDEAEREVETIRKVLDLRGEELVLDLCCGSGRHGIPLARLGCGVIGLDYSDKLLAIAEASRPRDMKYPMFVRADARSTVFGDGTFDVVLNLFTSFGYFEDNENVAFIRSIARLLKPGGRFYIDYLNPPRVLAGLVPESKKERNGITVIENRMFNGSTQRLEKTITLIRDGSPQIFHESVHLYNCSEMLDMISGARLSIDGVIGSINGDAYDESSERMILFGTRI